MYINPRTNTRRKHLRRQKKFAEIVAAHERAGDTAQEHHFHPAAAQHYQDALNYESVTPEARDRISQKLLYSLFVSNEPEKATPWCDRLLASYLATPGNEVKAVDILLKVVNQMWLDSRTKESLPIIAQSIQLAEQIGDRYFQIRANIKMSEQLRTLGRYAEAKSFLDAAPDITDQDPLALQVRYWRECANVAAVYGNAVEAYAYFERALSSAEQCSDDFGLAGLWQNYSYFAMNLGNMPLAKSCMERALLIARRNRGNWHITHLCVAYAAILTHIGQHSSAHSYLLEALSYDIHVPIVRMSFAEVGIPLALHMKDAAMLAKCLQPSVLTAAFQSGEPCNIGPVAAAFAKFYNAEGKSDEAQSLLHRAVNAVSPIDFGWHLPLEVARQGAPSDIRSARALLEARLSFPSCDIPRACLSLFDALVAQRRNKLTIAQKHAEEAVGKFEALQWYAYADEARSLIPHIPDASQTRPLHNITLSDISSLLTTREKEVADFVLRGLTNRAVASELAITENTVEKHMTSIMTRLGIRSRHQLANVVEGKSSGLQVPDSVMRRDSLSW